MKIRTRFNPYKRDRKKTTRTYSLKDKASGPIPCESRLEWNAILILSSFSSINQISAQDTQYTYRDTNGKLRKAFPDICVNEFTEPEIHEVKSDAALESRTERARLKSVKEAVNSQGSPYLVLSESVVYQQPRFRNLERIMHYRGVPFNPEQFTLLEKLDARKLWQVNELSTVFSNDKELEKTCPNPGLATVFYFLSQGWLTTDHSQELSPQSLLRITLKKDEQLHHRILFAVDPLEDSLP